MKLAIIFHRGRQNCSAVLRLMLDAQLSQSWHSVEEYSCGQGAVGVVRTSDRFSSIPLIQSPSNGNRLFVSGVPLDLSGSATDRIKGMADLDFRAALRELQSLDGAFTGVLWNPLERKLAIVTDILGMQPLYMYRDHGMLALASEVKALTATGLVKNRMDPAGWGAFLSFRHTIADRTLVRSIHRAPAGSVLLYAPDRDNLTCEPYWRWPDPRRADRFEDLPLEDLIGIFMAEIEAFRRHNSSRFICLSGGYDSRLILAALCKSGIRPETITLSHADEMFDLDAKLAARTARQFDAGFTLHRPDRGFFSSREYLEYLIANEVGTPSLYLFIAQLGAILEPSMQAVWEGVFPGCILFPIHQPPGGFDAYLRRECAPLDAVSWMAAERVFHPDRIKEMREAFSDCLSQERRRYPDDASGVSEFVVRNRTRHRIATNPMQVYSNKVLPFTPGISKWFWSIAASIPYALKEKHRLYQHIFERYFPEALTVPAVSGATINRLKAGVFEPDLALAKWGRVVQNNWRLGVALRKIGFAQVDDFWEPSAFVDEAVRQVDAGHPDLNGEEVRKLKTMEPPMPYLASIARDLLFYWHSWRRVMNGSLSASGPSRRRLERRTHAS